MNSQTALASAERLGSTDRASLREIDAASGGAVTVSVWESRSLPEFFP
jgi:hypothetical protein